jgi:phytoene synthase
VTGPAETRSLQPAATAEAGDVVRSVARAFERDRYLAALLAPRRVRDDLVVLAAFAGETGRIPVMVREAMAGEIRLQWWRDAIAAGNPASGHPVADALLATAARHCLPPALLLDVIDAVSERLDDQPFADLAQLTTNLDKREGTLFRLAHRILGGGEDIPVLATAGSIYGLARVLIEAPAELAQGRSLLPGDMLRQHGCVHDGGTGAQAAHGWRTLTHDLAAHAEQLLCECAPAFQGAPAMVRAALLPLALVRPYLGASQRADIAAMQVVDISPLTRVWRLWLARRLAVL